MENETYIHKSKTKQMCDMIDKISAKGNQMFTTCSVHTNDETIRKTVQSLMFNFRKDLSNYKKMHGSKTERQVHLRRYKRSLTDKAFNSNNKLNKRKIKTKKERRISKQRNIKQKRKLYTGNWMLNTNKNKKK